MHVIMERDIGASAAAPRQRRVCYLYLRRGSGRPRSAFISVRRRASIQNRCACAASRAAAAAWCSAVHTWDQLCGGQPLRRARGGIALCYPSAAATVAGDQKWADPSPRLAAVAARPAAALFRPVVASARPRAIEKKTAYGLPSNARDRLVPAACDISD